MTESVFAAPDVQALSQHFDRVIIAPLLRRGEPAGALPSNVVVSGHIADNPFWTRKWLRAFKALSPEVLGALTASGPFGSVKYALAAKTIADCLRRLAEDYRLERGQTLFMSYWFNHAATALMWLGYPYVSRAHGHDILIDKAVPLRARTLSQSLGVWAVSRAGAAALAERLGDTAGKAGTACLGSAKPCRETLASHHTAADRKVTFLSCSRVADIKRVWLNLDCMQALAAARPDLAIEWIHIGDGEGMAALRERAAAAQRHNLTIELAGACDNEAVHRMYAGRTIDWFLLLSTTEGLPVSVCEALSYGVPAIATDVGGTSEAVDDNCGILMPVDLQTDEFVMSLTPYLDSDYRYKTLSEGAFDKWRSDLDADALRPAFARTLASLIKDGGNLLG